jgi:superfamily II DNA or RNA helicase
MELTALVALADHELRADEMAVLLGRSATTVRKSLNALAENGFVSEDHPGRWTVPPAETPRLLAEFRARDLEGLRRLSWRLADDKYSAPSRALAAGIHELLLAVTAEDPARIKAVWTEIELEQASPYRERHETVSAWSQTAAGIVLRHSLLTGAWATFSPARKVWLLEIRTWGAVRFGVSPRGLPALLRVSETEPAVLQALDDWQAAGSLVAGDLDAADRAGTAGATVVQASVRVLTAWLRGDEAVALARLGTLREGGLVPGPLFAPLAALTLARGGFPVSKLKSWAAEHSPEWADAATILWASFRHQGKSDAAELYIADISKLYPRTPFEQLLLNWGGLWNGVGVGKAALGPQATALVEVFHGQEARWFEAEAGALVDRYLGAEARWARAPDVPGLARTLTGLVDLGAAWEVSLKRLADLKFDAPEGAKKPEQDVLVWLVNPRKAEVEPALRKPLKGGGWSAVRKAPLTRLGKGDHPAIQNDDRPALKAVVQSYYGWEIDHKRALEALAGHPRLFLADAVDTPLTLEAAEVELKVEETTAGLKFRFDAALDSDKARLTRVAADHWQVTVVTEKAKKVAAVVGSGLTVPLDARERVADVLGHLAAGIQVRSPLLQESQQVVNVAADPRPVLVLVPFEEGFNLAVHVRPLGPGTPLLYPGDGPTLVHARVGTQVLTTVRTRKDETDAWRAVQAVCPDLAASLAGDNEVTLSDPLEALTVLAELRDAAEAVTVEWPQGGKIRLHPRVAARSMRLSLGVDRQWFAVDGSVGVDVDRVVAFRELLEGGALNRFVKLADGDWIELEGQLLRQLEHLSHVVEGGKTLRISPLVLAGSELLLDGTITQAPEPIERWRTLWRAGVSPDLSLPASLTAELRPYQLDGYRWLARLAEVGAGACLADDMGLGKTVQAIALLARRSVLGPSLVVAPTSVAPNWISEIRRFDRSLEPVLFSEGTRASRKATVDALAPGQVLLVTYGLLVTENELLCARDWNVVVLDEAQAVKNIHAKRTKAVLNLKAGFRLAATGTPLQNHLGELWALFEFLNPGLLGSKASFAERFWGPIEAQQDEAARRSLQTLIRPFLLRRTKNQVLSELPEKIETTLAVELAPHERDFYEALRQRALEQMANLEDAKAGEERIMMLAHLMKLRRACCHPALAGGPESPTSSKLDLLEELLEGLIDNGHRTLVFSQFTDHLALIRARLEARGWAYETLEGSTPAAERGALVQRFQTGTAPVFLISLQAGGTGLNLTAADFVVHMDPWWNPAVEDQASDRAHRLGQTRPVTIYRLVARDTIEERIVELHRSKRDLAEALLEGTEAAARLGTKELLQLMAEGSH